MIMKRGDALDDVTVMTMNAPTFIFVHSPAHLLCLSVQTTHNPFSHGIMIMIVLTDDGGDSLVLNLRYITILLPGVGVIVLH